MERVEDVHKLAVLRANAIGDYLVSLPAIQALRTAYPAVELVLLGADWHAGFLAGRPGPVDRFFARMRAERFDLAVQLQGVAAIPTRSCAGLGPG